MLNTRDLYFCLFLWGDEVKIARKFHRKRSSYRVKYSLRSCSKAFSRSQKKNQNGFSFHTSLACISVLFLYDRAAMQLQLYSKQAHAHWDPDSPPKQCTTMITASHPLSLIPAKSFFQNSSVALIASRRVYASSTFAMVSTATFRANQSSSFSSCRQSPKVCQETFTNSRTS